MLRKSAKLNGQRLANGDFYNEGSLPSETREIKRIAITNAIIRTDRGARDDLGFSARHLHGPEGWTYLFLWSVGRKVEGFIVVAGATSLLRKRVDLTPPSLLQPFQDHHESWIELNV